MEHKLIFLVKIKLIDNVSAEKRSQVMALVKQKNTRPELLVRKYLHKKGLRYKIHNSQLPGKPDLVFPKYKTVVFVNGCFWHGHVGCPSHRIPKSNVDFWINKIETNKNRDIRNYQKLDKLGWETLTIWECEVKKEENLEKLYNLIIDK